MEKLQDIELTIDSEKDGVFAISLVEKPAIEEDFIYLSQHDIHLAVSNEDKRELIGLVLIPEKRIKRVVSGKEFNIWMSENTVKLSSEKYMTELNLNKVTVDHEHSVDDVSVVESWTVEDSKMDKSNLYNLNAVKGSWAVKMKVNNPSVWDDVKSGKYKGFSIEALYSGMDKALLESHNYDVLSELKSLIEKL